MLSFPIKLFQKSQYLPLSNKKEFDIIDEKQLAEDNVRSSAFDITFSHILLASSLIFGGCCSNVLTLESIVTDYPDAGKLITFTQFLFVALEGFCYNFDSSNKYLLKKPHIPLVMWLIPVALYFSISLLANMVWAYDISVPIQIIFRSGGTVFSMITGFLFMKKTYTPKQVVAGIILTIGVIMCTMQGSSQALDGQNVDSKFFQGIAMLLLAAVLTSFQGLVNERIYEKYGKHWRENLFYSHFFSLPFFLPILPQMVSQFKLLAASPVVFYLPKHVWMLLLNGTTQYFCVRGVNHLAGYTTALTVSVILNLRKFTSLLLSTFLFDNPMTTQGVIGAGLVFAGAMLYAYR